METNPYEYDRTLPWIPQQNQLYAGENSTVDISQQHSAIQYRRMQQSGEYQKLKPSERMPKAEALALANTLKKWLVIASLVSFGTLSGLAAFHQINTSANQTSPGSSPVEPTTPSSSQDNNGFFNQQGGNNFGSSNSPQAPFGGSSVS